MNLQELQELGINDIITLKDLQTQKEYNALSADFRIREIRNYNDPNGRFNYIGLICDYENKTDGDEQSIMVMVRNFPTLHNWDLFVYYLDNDGDVNDMIDFVTEDGEDLVSTFEVDLHFDDATLPVKWDKKQTGTTFGVESFTFASDDDIEYGVDPDCKTTAEYFTDDETRGNPHCFVEWTGDDRTGWVEIWYGCEITEHDIEVYNLNN